MHCCELANTYAGIFLLFEESYGYHHLSILLSRHGKAAITHSVTYNNAHPDKNNHWVSSSNNTFSSAHSKYRGYWFFAMLPARTKCVVEFACNEKKVFL